MTIYSFSRKNHLVISAPSGQVLPDDYIVTDTAIGKELRPRSEPRSSYKEAGLCQALNCLPHLGKADILSIGVKAFL